MAHSHKRRLPARDFFAQTKILFSESPGRTGLLIEDGKETPMKFEGAHQALDWCEANRATFYYLPPEATSQN